MRKNIMKRVLAATMSILTALSYMPMVTSVSADNTSNADYEIDDDLAYSIQMLQYLSTIGQDLAYPPVMISEGDQVYVDKTLISDTVVPVTRALIENQDKIRSTYWLDSLAVGTYEDLAAADTALKNYFKANTVEYNAIKKRLRNKLVALRDYCIKNGFTTEAVYADAAKMEGVAVDIAAAINAYGTAKDSFVKSEIPENSTDTEGSSETETKSDMYVNYFEPSSPELYVTVDDNGNFISKTLEDVESTRETIAENGNTDWAQELCDAAGLTRFQFVYTTYLSNISSKYNKIGTSLKVLLGDTTVDSETFIDEQLDKMGVDEMLYAYAALYTNLYEANQYTDTTKFNLYFMADSHSINDAKFVPVSDIMSYVAEMPTSDTETATDDSIYEYRSVISDRFAEYAKQCSTLYIENVGTVNTKYNNILTAFAGMLDGDYVITGLGSGEAACKETGDLQALAAQAEKVINNIPESLQKAWYILYDSKKGIDAVGKSVPIEYFKENYERKLDTFNGKWDFSASQYDAVKYVNETITVGDDVAVVKKALTNADGSEKYFSRQSEVTPWLDINLVIGEDDGAYLDSIGAETYRNTIDCVDANHKPLYNPTHRYEYNASNTEDLFELLKNGKYIYDKNASFILDGVNLQVDRYSLDNSGSDKKNIINTFYEADDESTLRGISVAMIYNLIRDAEYDAVDESELAQFTSFLKDLGITETTEETKEMYNIYLDAFKMDHSGFNGHNGYAITLKFIYNTSTVKIPETDVETGDSVVGSDESKKVLLTEIPEYSISEYYEDNSSLFTTDNIISSIPNDTAEYRKLFEALKSNPEKLQTADTLHNFSSMTDGAETLDSLMSRYTKNKTLTAVGNVYAVPEGVSLTLPAYVPVSGRTFDTRYFVKYINYPYYTIPSVKDTRYYASAYSNDTALNSIRSFVNETGSSASGFVALGTNSDKRGKLTVAYAQDRGATLYRAMQRLFTPVQQFTNTGNDMLNMNKHLTVNGNAASSSGYVGDSFETASSATATSDKAKALSNLFPVYYTGCEVNVLVGSGTAPELEFKTYAVDFANANVGAAWNSGYTSIHADELAQAYVDKYVGASGSIEYKATLSNTFSTSTLYDESSNAPMSSLSSTVAVEGRTQEPLTITEEYKADFYNSRGEKNKTEQVGEYAVEIRNGRVAFITVDGVKYNLYGNGERDTTEKLLNNSDFALLKAADYELAEAIVHMRLAEFAATLSHNEGNQNWQTYKERSIYKDNAGTTVPDKVKGIKSNYDRNFDGTAGWYAEDVTTLVIKEYNLRGELQSDYAFSYKVPIDYGFKSPRSKSDFFKTGTALYAYNELYFSFLGGETTTGENAGYDTGIFDVVGDEGNGILTEKPDIGYVISNATVDDMFAR